MYANSNFIGWLVVRKFSDSINVSISAIFYTTKTFILQTVIMFVVDHAVATRMHKTSYDHGEVLGSDGGKVAS